MDVLASIDDIPAGTRMALTVGVFDGMPRGHTALVGATVAAARRRHATPIVITFDPHPDAVLRGVDPPLLCDPAERLALLEAAGVGITVVQRFDREFASQSAEAFLDRLRSGRALAAIVMTPESAIGRGRAGTAESLRELGAVEGFDVETIEPLAIGGERISASRIRELLAEGRLAAARRLLGRRPSVVGAVVRGDARGRVLGYPTANLAFDAPVALPKDGIYAVRATWGGADPLHPRRGSDGVASLGVRPTFVPGDRILEVFLLDFDENLYGERLRVVFVRRQRGERRFASAEALIRQMDRDTARARAILARDEAPGGVRVAASSAG